MQWFLVILIGLPIFELLLMIKIGSAIGALSVIALLIISAVAGIYLLKDGSFNAFLRVQQRLQQGELPMMEVAESFLLGLAGILLILPGFFSDVIALLLLIVPLRRWLAQRFRPLPADASHRNSTQGFHARSPYRRDEDAIDGEWHDADTATKQRLPPP